MANSLFPYTAAVTATALALFLLFSEEKLLVAPMLLIAFLSFVSTRYFVREIEKAQEQKCSLDRQLIQSQKLASIGELSSGIAHEINNPLAIIIQEVEWIQHLFEKDLHDDSKGMDDLKDSVREIALQVNRCKEITHKLLDFARRKEPLIQSVDINRLIEDMAKLVEMETTQRGIRITREYCNDLPPVPTDPPLLRQVVLNLLNNASQAIEKDGFIKVATRLADGGEVELAVSDTGCGIPEENIGKIFDPFFTTKSPGKGTGLGLSICHGIITRLGGRISVASEVGKGSIFTVNLPVQLFDKG
jgi:two-component system, NtrC family, sensor kinase